MAVKSHIKIDDLLTVESLTPQQYVFLESYHDFELHLLHGIAGTGKTFLALYRALEDVLDSGTLYDRVIIIRSAVSARDIGHLPGDKEEKSLVYQLPYMSMCKDLFQRVDSYDRLKEQRKIEFALSSFIRGLTFDRAVIVVDEIQNLTYQELYTIITRIGIDSKMLFCGDTRQNDLNGKSGLDKFMKVLDNMPSCHRVEFGIDDIVRSDIVKEFIIAESRLYE
jgi:phosphate starvation-inducible PhoH-like protein